MKVYVDIFSNDELISDSFPIQEVDDVALEVSGRIVKKEAVKIDIGANPSTEEPEEEVQDNCEGQVNELVDAFRLQPTGFDKKSYLIYIKEYLKRVKAHLEANKPERVEAFQKGSQTFVKKIIENFNDYEFYTGESMDPEAMVIVMGYRPDGQTPFMYLFKDGLREIKM